MKDSFSFLDRLKIKAILKVRHINRNALENWARRTFRTQNVSNAAMPELESAAAHYGSPFLPEKLTVPKKIPAVNRLSLAYMLPYYFLDGAVFNLIHLFKIDKDVPWSPEFKDYPPFDPHPEGWADIQNDRAFTDLRIQGPNPFLLRQVEKGVFEVDYGPYFEGITDPVVCTFALKGDTLVPESIRVKDVIHKPGDAKWERAKFLANALDARYTIFQKHLEHTHLITGQSYAISTLALPADHPVRDYLSFFTYGTLVVNDFAFRLLVTPASYFLQANFVGGEHVKRMFENQIKNYSLNSLIPPKDIEERGLKNIPNHPYAEHAPQIWIAITRFVRSYLQPHYPDDAKIKADAALQAWHRQLMSLLPNYETQLDSLKTLDDLVEKLSVIVYLNVSHEICGDFAPYTKSNVADHKKLTVS